jgi:UDP-2,3-diacylglucosamine hydrolase
MRAWFAADLHLLPGPQPDQTARLSAFLARATVSADALYLLGDVFHCWYERGQRHVGDYDEVLLLLRETATRLPIHFLPGNRDFRAGPRLAALSGVRIHPERLVAEIAGEKVLLTHGDLYCTADLPYRLMRWLLVSAPGRALQRLIPWPLARRLVRTVQERPQSPLPHYWVGAEAIRSRSVVADQARHGVRRTVCGHAHVAETRDLSELDGTGVLHLVPAWRDGGACGVLDPRGFRLVGGELAGVSAS